jgi:hypothetical protein
VISKDAGYFEKLPHRPVKINLLASSLLALALFSCSKSTGSELRMALAPRISLGKDWPVYSEDSDNFYGTNIALLTSKFLRERAEAQLHQPVPSSLRVEANRVPNTSIISVVASGADDSVSSAFLSALFDQFIRFKHEQKVRYYRDTIVTIDRALTYVPPEYAKQLEAYKEQLVIASLVDVKPDFERIDY